MSELPTSTKTSETTEAGGLVIRIKSQNEAAGSTSQSSTLWKSKTSKPGSSSAKDKEDGTTEHEIYIPPDMRSGDDIIEVRKALKQRSGFNLEELYSAPVKVGCRNL